MVDTTPILTPYDEDNTVKSMMATYGIENVRGGSYSRVILSESEIEILRREINHAKGACLKCGKTGHYAEQCGQGVKKCTKCGRNSHLAKDCYAKTHLNGNKI